MKNIAKFLIGALVATPLVMTSCSEILDETPRSTITPQLMQTDQGVELALTSVYSSLRYFWGPVSPYYVMQYGTDETTYGNLVGSGSEEYRMDEYTLTPETGRAGVYWSSNMFAYINTCNAIIQNGEAGGADARLLGEARTLRAFYQFLLVQLYGGIPLDLGSGIQAYNTTAIRTSTRNSIEETYTMAEYGIIPQLEKAVTELAGSSRNDRQAGCVTLAFAQYVLAKAYLTYGWYLKNNGGNGQEYFQKAYSTAKACVDNPSGFALETYYHDVHDALNDRNAEILLYADRSDAAGFSASEGDSWGTESAKGNIQSYAIRPWFDTGFASGPSPCGRAAEQDYGRPWRRMAPTYEAITRIFADKTNDSRYDGTFQKVWKCNQNAGSAMGVSSAFALGDTVIYMPGYEIEGASEPQHFGGSYPVQTLPGKNYGVFTPKHMTRENFPALWKQGPYNPLSGNANSSSLRPVDIAKLSEVYLIGAEAAVMLGNTENAKALIRPLRERAANRVENTPAQNEAAKAALLADLDAQTIDIDFILDERSRELFGEGLRWLDLVRTKKLSRAKTYSICPFNKDTAQPLTTFTRPGLENIENEPNSKYYLHPIPQTFIDALDMDDASKKAYQNELWR